MSVLEPKAHMNAAALGGCLYWLCASLENQALISTQWETFPDTSTWTWEPKLHFRMSFEQMWCRSLSHLMFLRTVLIYVTVLIVALGAVGASPHVELQLGTTCLLAQLTHCCCLGSWLWTLCFNRKISIEAGHMQKQMCSLVVTFFFRCAEEEKINAKFHCVTWASNFPALCRKVMQISCKPRISQELFSKHSNTPHPTSPALTRQCWISAKTSIDYS